MISALSHDLKAVSYTTKKSVAAATLNLRAGNTTPWRSDRRFKTQIVWTGLLLHHMSCKVCETLGETAIDWALLSK